MDKKGKLETKGTKGRHAKVLRETLDADDWKNIMGVRWNETQRKALDVLKKNGNGCITSRKVSEELGLGREDGMLFDYMNTIFRKNKLPYRIMVFDCGGHRAYSEKLQKLVVTDR